MTTSAWLKKALAQVRHVWLKPDGSILDPTGKLEYDFYVIRIGDVFLRIRFQQIEGDWVLTWIESKPSQ